MDCGQADILLVDYLYGELPEQQRQAFELHLQSCPMHAKEVERSRAVLLLMRKDPREDPSDRVSKEIVRAAEESIHRTSRPWGWLGWIRTPIAAAAALLVVIGIGALVYFNERFDRRSSVITSETAQPSQSPSDTVIDNSAVAKEEKQPNKSIPGGQPQKMPVPVIAKEPSSQKLVRKANPADRMADAPRGEPKPARQASRYDEIAQSGGMGAVAAEGAKPIAAGAPASMAARAKEESSNEPTLSDSDAALTIRRYMGEFAACARKYASIKGKMVLDITIVNNGVVTNVSIPEKFKGTEYADCIVSWVKKILFPKFKGPPKTVSFPLVTR